MERTVSGWPGRLGRAPSPPHQQPEPAKHVPWEPVQQSGQERPVARAEPRSGRTQLPLQHRDLVT